MPTLNLLLHGLFAVVEEPFRVVAAVPVIPDHNEYNIGVENGTPARHYGRGTYELTGTNRAVFVEGLTPATFHPGKNAKIRGKSGITDVLATAPPAYAIFTLPRPQNISSCRCFNFGTDLIFFGLHASEIASKKFATINVLSYSFDDIDRLRFAGLPDLKMVFTDESHQFVNVVIVARGHHNNSVAISAAFDKMMTDLIPSKDIHLVSLTNDPQPDMPCTGIPGVTPRTFGELLQLELNLRTDDCVPSVVDNT